AVRWHIFKTITIDSIVVKPFVNEWHDRNSMREVTIVLRQDVVANRFKQMRLLRGKKANRRNLLNTLQHHRTGRRVPEPLLAKRVVARVVARLGFRLERLPGD